MAFDTYSSNMPDEMGPVARRPLTTVGAVAWMSTIQFFVAQFVVSLFWTEPVYSWADRTISELGAIRCGVADGRYMCSPHHVWMNISFIALGLAMTLGALQLAGEGRHGRFAFGLMAVGGLGAVMVGFVPMDTDYTLHIIGADIAFLFGNIALILFGLTLRDPLWLRVLALLAGVVALTGLVLFVTHNQLFLGLGGMERVAAYPMVLWMFGYGLSRFRSAASSARDPRGRAAPADRTRVTIARRPADGWLQLETAGRSPPLRPEPHPGELGHSYPDPHAPSRWNTSTTQGIT